MIHHTVTPCSSLPGSRSSPRPKDENEGLNAISAQSHHSCTRIISINSKPAIKTPEQMQRTMRSHQGQQDGGDYEEMGSNFELSSLQAD